MALRVGFLGVAHMHAWGYLAALRSDRRATPNMVWDDDAGRRDVFGLEGALGQAESAEALVQGCDAVIVTSENLKHGRDLELVARHGKPALCEKPVAASDAEVERISKLRGSRITSAFPCRLAPGYLRLKERVKAGELGPLRAICATNRGRCPFDWFVHRDLSGGGALIDHTVHVADLLRDLLGAEPAEVRAQIGRNLYDQDWEDTAMLTLDYGYGLFATIDSSWSRPGSFKTWGDVTMNVVGDKGVAELDLFGQEVQVWGGSHSVAAFGSNLDRLLIDAWVSSILEDREPPMTLDDGLSASRVALAAYRSVVA